MSAVDDYSRALDYLRVLARQELAGWWTMFDTAQITDAHLEAAFADITGKYGEQASQAAVDYLVVSRSLDDDLAGLHFPQTADPVGYEQALSAYEWAMEKYREQSDGATRELAQSKLNGVLDRLVTLPARETVVKNVLRDGTAYARVPEPGACGFCLMLGSRGAVYTRKTVGAVNKYHDRCRCLGIEVKRDGSNLPQINKDLKALWEASGSTTQADFQLALATRVEFASAGDARNTRVYKLPDESRKASIIRWQGKDRFYEEVQKAASSGSDDPEALRVLDDLDIAASNAPLNQDVLMWRGVRNWKAAFGVETFDSVTLYDQQQTRFTAITADRNIAETEFTTFGKAGALLKIRAKAGTRGVWMPSNGDPAMVSQQEFLVPPGARMKVVSVCEGKLLIIEVELSNE